MTKKLLILCLAFSLINCGGKNFRETLGLKADAPDEFMVAERKEIIIPKNFTLPKPGQETQISERRKAGDLILPDNYKQNDELSNLEESIASNVGIVPQQNIREVIARENEQGVFGIERGSMLEKIADPFGVHGVQVKTIDPDTEEQRIIDEYF